MVLSYPSKDWKDSKDFLLFTRYDYLNGQGHQRTLKRHFVERVYEEALIVYIYLNNLRNFKLKKHFLWLCLIWSYWRIQINGYMHAWSITHMVHTRGQNNTREDAVHRTNTQWRYSCKALLPLPRTTVLVSRCIKQPASRKTEVTWHRWLKVLVVKELVF